VGVNGAKGSRRKSDVVDSVQSVGSVDAIPQYKLGPRCGRPRYGNLWCGLHGCCAPGRRVSGHGVTSFRMPGARVRSGAFSAIEPWVGSPWVAGGKSPGNGLRDRGMWPAVALQEVRCVHPPSMPQPAIVAGTPQGLTETPQTCRVVPTPPWRKAPLASHSLQLRTGSGGLAAFNGSARGPATCRELETL